MATPAPSPSGAASAAGSGTEVALTLSNCALHGNAAAGDGQGGGIYNGIGETLTVTNSLVTGNSGIEAGGGIDNDGTLTVTNPTFSGNTVTFNGGGIISDGDVTVAIPLSRAIQPTPAVGCSTTASAR